MRARTRSENQDKTSDRDGKTMGCPSGAAAKPTGLRVIIPRSGTGRGAVNVIPLSDVPGRCLARGNGATFGLTHCRKLRVRVGRMHRPPGLHM
jgi:hypothetical protein